MDEVTKLKAYAMRMEGMSWDTIAQLLHYDRTALSRAVGEPLKRDKISRKRKNRYAAKHRA